MSDKQMIVQIRFATGDTFTYSVDATEVDGYVEEAHAVGAEVSVATALPVRRRDHLHSVPSGAA